MTYAPDQVQQPAFASFAGREDAAGLGAMGRYQQRLPKPCTTCRQPEPLAALAALRSSGHASKAARVPSPSDQAAEAPGH
jgi:hypothetical protein